MKSRFDPIVDLKKSELTKREASLVQLGTILQNAKNALQNSYDELGSIDLQKGGVAKEMHKARALVDLQRATIVKNREWVAFASSQLEVARREYEKELLELEKFKYLQSEEIREKILEIKKKESKELDEIAALSYARVKNANNI